MTGILTLYGYTVAFHVADLKYLKEEKYRALRQVSKKRRLVKRYEFLISPRMSTSDLSRLIALARVMPRFLERARWNKAIHINGQR